VSSKKVEECAVQDRTPSTSHRCVVAGATRVALDLRTLTCCRDVRFNQQTSRNNAYLHHLLAVIENYPYGDFWAQLFPNPVYHVATWWHKREMYKYLSQVLRARFAENNTKAAESQGGTRKRSVIDLALQSYTADSRSGKNFEGLDPEFERYAVDQMNVFIFAGHDTTSSAIAYAYHLMSQHPQVAEMMIREHNDVFGENIERVPQLLREQPYLINRLEYTLAVIKESLRLFPPASTLRKGSPE